MGIFDFLFGRFPSSDWILDERFLLHADLLQSSLCGVAIESRFDLLEGLGPAENPKEARKGTLAYYSRGLEISIDFEEESMDHFRLVWNDDLFLPWEGSCYLAGREISLSTETSPEDVCEIFGEPSSRDESFGGLELEFEIHDVLIEIDFTVENRLWDLSMW